MQPHPLKPAIAEALLLYLDKQLEDGKKWVVYEMDHPFSRMGMTCFKSESDAINYEYDHDSIVDMLNTTSIKHMQDVIRQSVELMNSELIRESIPQQTNNMNRNNLETLQKDLKTLGFDQKLIEQMEKNMEKDLPEFKLQKQMPGDKRQLDYTLHFKKSGQSDYYYFNKFNVSLTKGKALEEGQKYMVITKDEKDKASFKSFSNPSEAIEHFKMQREGAELALGKDPGNKVTLATIEKGKDKASYVSEEFRKQYYSPALTQTFFVDKGKAFTAEQAGNLIQGRSVYRDDLLNINGIAYKAWMKLELDGKKDRFGNWPSKQYHDPSYGFDLSKTLDRFTIKELDDPAKRTKLENSLRNGNQPVVTVAKDGEEVKLKVEAMPRYNNVNFYRMDGKPEKREALEKDQSVQKSLSVVKGKEKAVSEGQEMGI